MKSKACMIFAVLLPLVFLTACPQHTTIAKINNDPGVFQNKEVTVAGRVSGSFGALA